MNRERCGISQQYIKSIYSVNFLRKYTHAYTRIHVYIYTHARACAYDGEKEKVVEEVRVYLSLLDGYFLYVCDFPFMRSPERRIIGVHRIFTLHA